MSLGGIRVIRIGPGFHGARVVMGETGVGEKSCYERDVDIIGSGSKQAYGH